ncbi:serine hydrolase domain-containing protein [Croceivirga thetidis]|uniref:Beta-lactamase family protein n=1 Tax=Croceivirga thetidis TaxID=2721623 RepID=A0ABX1GN00_9FLAO|nr:serine hydrolase domain-containing protein [Croceivirga thetidis]NKI30445.1 beta-lactamase family protein [Croceivirga thetidis]
MTQKIFATVLFFLAYTALFSQNLNTQKLDDYFDSLEQRNLIMGSISIAQNGIPIYSRAIGFRSISGETKIKADTVTNYRIWSITKLYTATMITQLIEEGKLSLDTKLSRFYPQIPNAERITIKSMLNHKSGIHDFTQNDTEEDWDATIAEPMTPKFMVAQIAKYPSDFEPNSRFNYSNSNYLLLGYIIEKLDGSPYGTSLGNRIISKLGLQSTYFGVGALDSIDNKANTYAYKKTWFAVDEGEFSGLIPAGAGGIVSTSNDMGLFIQGLFAGKLVSKESLATMIPKNESYGLGIMKTSFQELATGYGHTGGYLASESSLFHYPKQGLSIAFATNGLVIPKEEILDNVLKIYYDKPFGISMNRKLQALLIFCIGLLLFLVVKLKLLASINQSSLLYLGYATALLFWIGSLVASRIHGNHSFIKDGVTKLDEFYSNSGTFMAGIQFIMVFLLLLFFLSAIQKLKLLKLSILPIAPILVLPITLFGSTIFPFPNGLYQIFTNSILLIILGPILVTIFWRKKEVIKFRWQSAACLGLMLGSIFLIFNRPSFPEFIHNHWGIIQRLFYLGWTLWLCFLSYQLLKLKTRQ